MRLFCFLLICLNLIGPLRAQDDFVEHSGDVIQLTLPALAFGSTFIWKDEQNATFQVLKTFGVSLVITQGVKHLIDKERPNGNGLAFPSGHSSAAFTGAAILEKRFGWKVGIPSYALASYVGWTRVDSNKHDYWDVLAGAIVGIGSAYLFVRPYTKQEGLDISMQKRKEGYMLSLSYNF